MAGENLNDQPQEQQSEKKNELAIGLSKADFKTLESKYPKINNADTPSLKFALNAIASPKSTGGLGREFVNNTILKPNANVPQEAIIALAKELSALQQQQTIEQQAVLSADELKQLETLFTDANTTPQHITDFFTQQKEEFTTVGEVMSKSPEQEKLLEGFRGKVANELIGKYPNLKNDPDLLQNLSLSTLDRYTGRVNNKIVTSKGEETQIQQNKLLNTPLFAPKDAVLTTGEQQKLNTVLEQINSTLDPKNGVDTASLQFTAFTAQDFHNMLDACVTNAVDIKTFNKEQTLELKTKQVALGKELDSFVDGFTNAPKGNQTMETITTVSKKVFENLSKVGEGMKDYIENNFGTFETVFAIPLIGPFLKDLLVGKEGEEADRYKNAKAIYEKKGATLSEGEQVVSTAIAEKYNNIDTNQADLAKGHLQNTLSTQPWFTALYKVPASPTASLTAEQTQGKNTQDALQKFDDVAYLKTIFDAETIGKLTMDTTKIGEKDPLYGKDIKAYLLTTMYMRLGNTESVANKLAQERITEFKDATPSEQLQKDFATYAEGRLEKICGEQKIAFAGPLDIVNALTFDLLKDSDQAVLARLKPAVATATTPAAPAAVNAPATTPVQVTTPPAAQ